MDLAFIKECADPSLKSAIVEQLVMMAGSVDPLAITVKSGGRLVLIPKPKSVDEAMDVVREHVGRAVVRAEITQLPVGVGVGVKEISELKTDLVDPCENLRKGTGLFARILRMVSKCLAIPRTRKCSRKS